MPKEQHGVRGKATKARSGEKAPPAQQADDGIETCPLCVETLDETDREFYPCPCGYQVCLFCYGRIKEEFDKACPHCRQTYDDANVVYRKRPARVQQDIHAQQDVSAPSSSRQPTAYLSSSCPTAAAAATSGSHLPPQPPPRPPAALPPRPPPAPPPRRSAEPAAAAAAAAAARADAAASSSPAASEPSPTLPTGATWASGPAARQGGAGEQLPVPVPAGDMAAWPSLAGTAAPAAPAMLSAAPKLTTQQNKKHAAELLLKQQQQEQQAAAAAAASVKAVQVKRAAEASAAAEVVLQAQTADAAGAAAHALRQQQAQQHQQEQQQAAAAVAALEQLRREQQQQQQQASRHTSSGPAYVQQQAAHQPPQPPPLQQLQQQLRPRRPAPPYLPSEAEQERRYSVAEVVAFKGCRGAEAFVVPLLSHAPVPTIPGAAELLDSLQQAVFEGLMSSMDAAQRLVALLASSNNTAGSSSQQQDQVHAHALAPAAAPAAPSSGKQRLPPPGFGMASAYGANSSSTAAAMVPARGVFGSSADPSVSPPSSSSRMQPIGISGYGQAGGSYGPLGLAHSNSYGGYTPGDGRSSLGGMQTEQPSSSRMGWLASGKAPPPGFGGAMTSSMGYVSPDSALGGTALSSGNQLMQMQPEQYSHFGR